MSEVSLYSATVACKKTEAAHDDLLRLEFELGGRLLQRRNHSLCEDPNVSVVW